MTGWLTVIIPTVVLFAATYVVGERLAQHRAPMLLERLRARILGRDRLTDGPDRDPQED